ncbi:Uncharacterised protein [Candidatus Bartonella washoeensis]|uniref:Uncharacterized protein n=1 Tax=Candidatus Bartonella washoeensis Sb944nv TaxID=1094563 RepID=J1J443_9HYPH|nr:hypothetical protein [Bartonella washoeensis]EJF78440.1 hypothetical protein MCQ_01302 [Bartonella washoeensis Sb944nv]SPU27779.1 Uncharacterised protein [Bartonella washoeensis]
MSALSLACDEQNPLYFTVFPQAEDKLVELGVAIYEYFGGWSNSSKKFQDFIYRYGNDKARVNAHSRGSLTVGNGLHDFEQHGIHGIAKKTDIYLFGPAYNAQAMANTLNYVSDGKKDHVYLQNHLFDPIGIGFGHNPPTAYKVPLKFPYVLYPPAIPMREIEGALAGHDPSTHNCYGNARDVCTRRYGSFTFKKVHSTRTGNKK